MQPRKKPLNIEIGARVKAAREQARLTQEKLAESVGVSVQYISDLERGKVGASVQTIIRIASVLHTCCDYILPGQRPGGGPVFAMEVLILFCKCDRLSSGFIMVFLHGRSGRKRRRPARAAHGCGRNYAFGK